MKSSRLIRIFISSTFRDFMGERDEMVKRVFPELRRRCKARFIELLEVDLRWGITEEQSRQGATLNICLQEINRCRPSLPVFFIGLLGERYGWVPPPDYYPMDMLEDPELGWVREHVGGKSVTELEILHGVLNNLAMAERAFFYFRQDGYEKRHWWEIAESYPHLKPEDFTNEKEDGPIVAKARQTSLKERVLKSGLKHAAKLYETPEQVAAMVREDLWRHIDTAFPASEVPDALEQETLDHQVFRDSRIRAYTEREGLFEELDAHAEGNGTNVRVVLGESGSGKSALLAAWLARHENRVVFFHFTGATPQSVSAEALLRRLLATLRKRGVVSASEQIPENGQAMAALLPSWMEKLSDAGGGVILLDALNQMSRARDRELWWWPKQWPENVRVVFSTLPGDAWREMERRGWTGAEQCLAVPPLRAEEKHSIMNLYLEQFSRSLEKALQEKILDALQTANPLFLRTVLDELRLRSRHEDLGSNLEAMLRCADPAALFVYVLKNLERDFTPAEHPGMVHTALGLMGVSRRGLAESEFLELLSSEEKPMARPLPRHYWAPLFLALEDSLVSREGQLSFFHDYLRQAVWREYLDERHELEAAHERLSQTVTRWREDDAFGASLKHYGFNNGISHLLAIERKEDAMGLLLDYEYRKAAARTLRDAEPVQRDVTAVRRAVALAGKAQVKAVAELTALALRVRDELTRHLRDILDDRAAEGQWDEVMGLVAAPDDAAMQLLLALRAVAQTGPPKREADSGELRLLLTRWAGATGKEEWLHLVECLLAR